jgi:hypothetical protein
MVGKAQKLHGARSGLYGGCSSGVPPIHFFQTKKEFNSKSLFVDGKITLECVLVKYSARV